MKIKMLLILLLSVFLTEWVLAEDEGIFSLNLNDIMDFYKNPINNLQELEPAGDKEYLTENRLRINFLSRHITALKKEDENDISDHLKSIYKDSIITLYEKLDQLQSGIINDNIRSINEISEYLAQIRNKKQYQDDIINDIGERIAGMLTIMDELSAIFDSYDRIIERQNDLVETAIKLSPEAYANTVFLAPGLEAGTDLTPYISLGLGYITAADKFSYGGILEAGYSPGEELVNVSFSVLLGFNFGRNED